MGKGWNHRVIRHKNDMKEPWFNTEPFWYGIHEVYYDDNDKPYMMTKNAISIVATTPEEMKWTINKIMDSIDKPILDEEEFCDTDKE